MPFYLAQCGAALAARYPLVIIQCPDNDNANERRDIPKVTPEHAINTPFSLPPVRPPALSTAFT
ncbi:MAG: hypothetical protein WCO71_09135, partial [Pseudomonadota bacterium]